MAWQFPFALPGSSRQLIISSPPPPRLLQLPEVSHVGSLVLDFATLADVYLGTVDTWNHSAIRQLNPSIAHLLPDINITVVLCDRSSIILNMLTQVLRDASPEFRARVRSYHVDMLRVCLTSPNRSEWTPARRCSQSSARAEPSSPPTL
jgi:hypothetical protein